MEGPPSSGTPPDDVDREAISAETGRLLAARLPCPSCEKTTDHRLLRLAPRKSGRAGPLRGIARCRVCRLTHPFDAAVTPRPTVSAVVSSGAVSKRHPLELPPDVTVRVGERLPGADEPLEVRSIDTVDGRRVRSARSEEIATVWLVRDVGAVVPVSVISGAQTRSVRLTFSPSAEFEVGEPLEVEGVRLMITALRARGHTYRFAGDRFRASELERIYGRRTEIPPVGRSAWRSGRGMPSSRTSSTSRSDRSRSGPGVRRTRTVPRRRTASTGATVQSVSLS